LRTNEKVLENSKPLVQQALIGKEGANCLLSLEFLIENQNHLIGKILEKMSKNGGYVENEEYDEKEEEEGQPTTTHLSHTDQTWYLPIIQFENNKGGLFLFLKAFHHFTFEEVERHFPVHDARARSFPGTTEAHDSTAFSNDVSVYHYKRKKKPTYPLTPWHQMFISFALDVLRCLPFPKANFNLILTAKYNHGSDSIGYHSDDEVPDEKPILCCVFQQNLEEIRTVRFRPKCNRKHTIDVGLKHGDMYFMYGGTFQNEWEHSVPKSKKLLGKRLCLSLRQLNKC